MSVCHRHVLPDDLYHVSTKLYKSSNCLIEPVVEKSYDMFISFHIRNVKLHSIVFRYLENVIYKHAKYKINRIGELRKK